MKYDYFNGFCFTNRRSWIHSFQILVQDGSKILDRIDKSCLFSQESCRYNLGWPVKNCLFCQESCILENQVKFLLLNQEKTLAWSPRWIRILATRPRKSRIWKERWQERRLVFIVLKVDKDVTKMHWTREQTMQSYKNPQYMSVFLWHLYSVWTFEKG
jgi:hypothetical protein